MHSPSAMSLSPLVLASDVTDVTFRASGHWLGSRRGAGGAPHWPKAFYRSLWPPTYPVFRGSHKDCFSQTLKNTESLRQYGIFGPKVDANGEWRSLHNKKNFIVYTVQLV